MNYNYKCVTGTVSENFFRTFKSKSVLKIFVKVAGIYGISILLCFFVLFKRHADFVSYLNFSIGFFTLTTGSFLILTFVVFVKILSSKKMEFSLSEGQIFLRNEKKIVSHFQNFFVFYREGFCLEIVNNDNYFKSFFIYGDQTVLEGVIKVFKENGIIVKDYLTNKRL
ncbi:MAG: hypothetical protein ACOVP4_10475 [Bacteriovoracaceae bacterium]